MASDPPKKGEARRREILDAALACFLERGFEATTIEAIRARSGASTGSIYHLFPGKEAIAGVLLVETLREFQEGLLAELEEAAGAADAVRAIVVHYCAWVEESPDRARFLFAVPRGQLPEVAREEVRTMNRALHRAIGALVERHTESGAIRKVPRDLLAPIVMGPAQEHARAWLAGLAKTTPRRAARHLADAAWAALQPSE